METFTLKFDDSEFLFRWWNEEQLFGTVDAPIGFDCETRLIRRIREPVEGEDVTAIPNDPLDVPELALAMAYDGKTLVLIHPSKLDKFLMQHRNQSLVGHNLSFDIAVCLRSVRPETKEIIWSLGDNNRLSDTMVLDMLSQLALGRYRGKGTEGKLGEDKKIYPANLAILSKEFGCGDIDKTDPYRLRFGELCGKTETEITANSEFRGFTDYALCDVIATHRIYKKQRIAAIGIMRDFGWSEKKTATYEIRPDALQLWGPLGEYIQVRASITLTELSRTPLRIDLKRRGEMEKEAREKYNDCLKVLMMREPEIVKTYQSKQRKGEIKLTKKSGIPQFNQGKLVAVLEAEARRHNEDIVISPGKKKGTSTSAKAWTFLASKSEFITAWIRLERIGKLLEFMMGLNAEKVYSRYNLLMRTGRVSAGAYKYKNTLILPSLNSQQIPKTDKDDELSQIRRLIIADPGYVLFTCDIVYAELRTLSASCLARYGFSKLAEAIIKHTNSKTSLDPHENAALAMLDITETEFRSHSKQEQKKMRQNVKPFSFGVPGGLGAKKLVAYAAANYDVHLTPKQAKEAKKKFLAAYPEIGPEYHLCDFSREGLAYQFQVPLSLIPKLRDFQKIRMSLWLRGEEELTEGEEENFWQMMTNLAYKSPRKNELLPLIETKEITNKIRDLFNYRAANLTGLIRGNVNYSQRANMPMQSLASSAAKEVLWALMRRGYVTKVYVHDEFIVQLPELTAKAKAKELEKLINMTLEKTVGMGIPMAVEGAIAKTWQKV